MQKKRYLLVVLLFIIPSAYAIYEEVAVEGWINNTGSLTADDNRTFEIRLAPGNLKIIAHLPTGDSLSVKNDSCEMIGFYDVCFISSQFSYHDYEEDRDYYKARVTIYDLVAHIELNRTIDNTDLLINEEANIDIHIKNAGEREATDIKFTDRFPSTFVITSISGCKIYGDEIVWEGSLKKLFNQKCSYTIKPTANISYTSKANLSYFNGMEAKNIYSDSESLNIPDYQLKIEANLTKTKAELDDKLSLHIKFQNNHTSYLMRVESFYIEIPIGLEISNIPSTFNRQYNKLSWHGALEAGKEKESQIDLIVKQEKYYEIQIQSDYIINNKRKSIKKILTLNKPISEIEEDIILPVEENITADLNESTDVIDESTDLTNETDTITPTTEDTTTTPPETETKEEKEEREPVIANVIKRSAVKIKDITKSIIIGIYEYVFKKPLFIVIDAILISLIVIIIINIRKSKKRMEQQ